MVVGDLKKALVADTGLQPEQQRLLYKGKEKKDRDSLSEAGLKDKSKVVLVEDKVGWEKKLLELRKTEAIANANKSVSQVQLLVDKVSGQVSLQMFMFQDYSAHDRNRGQPECELYAFGVYLMYTCTDCFSRNCDPEWKKASR